MGINVQNFDRKAFEGVFANALASLVESEKVTRATLATLSRTVLEALHCTEDVAFVNRLIGVLTPVNRKVVIKFFQAFGGFHFSQEKGEFSKKDKATYAEKREQADAFLDDPNQNIWTWAERNIEVETKEFTLESVTKYAERALKKAEKAGINQVDLLRAMFKGGFTPDSLLAIMDEAGFDVEIAEQA